jgi:hypothetical protein
MGHELPDEGQVVKSGDAEHGLVNAVALDSAVSQDLSVLQTRQGVFDSGSGPAMNAVLRLLLRTEMRLATSSAVWDEQAGSLVAAVGDNRASRQARSIPDSVNARQSLQLPPRPGARSGRAAALRWLGYRRRERIGA